MRSTIIAVFAAALILELSAGAQAGTITYGPTLHDNGGPPFYLGYKVGTFDVPQFLAGPADILTSVLLRVKVESYDGKHAIDNNMWDWSGSVTLGIGAYVGVQGPIPAGGSRLTVDSRATETATGSVTIDHGGSTDFLGPDSFSITGHYAADTKADSRTAALDLAPYIGAGDVTFAFTGGTSTYGTGWLPDGGDWVIFPYYKFTTTVEYTFTPEPATLSLLALGGLLAMRRRGNK
jgi:hypothetical protein